MQWLDLAPELARDESVFHPDLLPSRLGSKLLFVDEPPQVRDPALQRVRPNGRAQRATRKRARLGAANVNRLADFTLAGGLDLFTGEGGIAKEMQRRGILWILSFEIERSREEDLNLPANRRLISKLTQLKAFLAFGAAPVCSSFSRAVHPPWRSRAYPKGLPGLGEVAFKKVSVGNNQASWVSLALEEFRACSSGRFWVENPDGSFIWLLPEFQQFGNPASSCIFRFDMCQYGTVW